MLLVWQESRRRRVGSLCGAQSFESKRENLIEVRQRVWETPTSPKICPGRHWVVLVSVKVERAVKCSGLRLQPAAGAAVAGGSSQAEGLRRDC